jgi:hypothetical protein
MIKNKTDLLDPTAESDLSEYEKQVVEDARNAGKNLESTVPGESDGDLTAEHKMGGIIEQTVDSKAVEGFGKPGGDTDVSGGIANLEETAGEKVVQNEYND